MDKKIKKIGVIDADGYELDNRVYSRGGYRPRLRQATHESIRYARRSIVIGQMDNTIDHTFESANRVYSRKASSPTIPTCGGGGIQPKVIKQWKRN